LESWNTDEPGRIKYPRPQRKPTRHYCCGEALLIWQASRQFHADVLGLGKSYPTPSFALVSERSAAIWKPIPWGKHLRKGEALATRLSCPEVARKLTNSPDHKAQKKQHGLGLI
jgi:hypothetical protein